MNGTKTAKWVLQSAIALASVASFGSSMVAEDDGASDKESVSSQGTEVAKTREIPLEQIWALDMPGTRNIREIDSERPQDSQIEPIRKSLSSPEAKEKGRRRGFVVLGMGAVALRGAYDVFTAGMDVQDEFVEGEDISIVFFSREFARYVHLCKVERQEDIIELRYRYAPHDEAEVTEHFALIPLMRLSPGKYRVTMVKSPMAKEFVDLGSRPASDLHTKGVVCEAFSFVVKARESKRQVRQ